MDGAWDRGRQVSISGITWNLAGLFPSHQHPRSLHHTNKGHKSSVGRRRHERKNDWGVLLNKLFSGWMEPISFPSQRSLTYSSYQIHLPDKKLFSWNTLQFLRQRHRQVDVAALSSLTASETKIIETCSSFTPYWWRAIKTHEIKVKANHHRHRRERKSCSSTQLSRIIIIIVVSVRGKRMGN